ncbi:MAG TPA: hypothetical protein VEI53_07220 [Ktedonobacteraceae bacterium]|nr:hypothetical protein [Ktedonobacteraceae bacterium]
MPRDERKRQKALMKQRSKHKAAAQHKAHQQTLTLSSPKAILRQARSYPLYECLISDNWDKKENSGLVQILIAREQPDGDICFGVYLIDTYCLGLKNTFANAGFSHSRYMSEIRNNIFRAGKPVDCSIELANQMIYQSIEYAEQFGFEPEKDFVLSQYLLPPRGELEEPYKLTFGKDGKPFFISGPHDNVERILRQLDKTAGPGNYHYMAMIGGNPFVDEDEHDDFDIF